MESFFFMYYFYLAINPKHRFFRMSRDMVSPKALGEKSFLAVWQTADTKSLCLVMPGWKPPYTAYQRERVRARGQRALELFPRLFPKWPLILSSSFFSGVNVIIFQKCRFKSSIEEVTWTLY